MSIEENKTFVREYLDAINGQPKTASLSARYIAEPALIDHIQACETAFPCYRLDVDEMLAEGDLVSVRGMIRGVHQGPFMGVAATGNPVEFSIYITYRVQDGKIVDHWMLTDDVALMRQIGMIPAMA